MTCLYGSQKKGGAVDFINPNDIGALCALFGLEGGLCRLLDLVSSAIKKIASLNPDTGNADQVFGDILKKVVKTSYKLVIDELTGQIDVSEFCKAPPPPLPENITYYDIYQFIAELVPILNYFFTVNDILLGNSTKLLDKIVGFWLYQKWFENCECKSQDNKPYEPYKPLPRFEYNYGCADIRDSDVDYINEKIAVVDRQRKLTYESIVLRNQNWKDGSDADLERIINDYANRGVTVSNIREIESVRASLFSSETYFTFSGCLSVYRLGTVYPIKYITLVGDLSGTDFYYGIAYTGETRELAEYQIETLSGTSFRLDASNCNCPENPPPPPPPPPEFCSLFPDDPLCVVTGCTDPTASNYNLLATVDDGSCVYDVLGCTDQTASNYNPLATVDDGSCVYCQSIDIEVVEFSECGSDRTTKTVQLFDCGQPFNVSVVEFSQCGSDRTAKTVQLFDCV